jgi:uncharacterized membrane protein YkvA (DUF1232 family)
MTQNPGRLRQWARNLKRDVYVVWLAGRDPRVPRHTKILALVTAGYALSPIDLIPDFIPVLGLLDDLILVPLGLWLTLRSIPPPLLQELRAQAAAGSAPSRSGRLAAAAIVMVWVAVGVAAMIWGMRLYRAWHAR